MKGSAHRCSELARRACMLQGLKDRVHLVGGARSGLPVEEGLQVREKPNRPHSEWEEAPGD